MKKDCPHKKDSGSKQKVAKIKYKSRDLPEKGSDAVGSVVKPEDAAPTPAPQAICWVLTTNFRTAKHVTNIMIYYEYG